ncbi:MAG: protoporphyrinogen oxidase [Syntrophomonadaceae bacterium]|nr:protoporphyrinogen oxidase [Syntrophomonadaceae bacterium]
MNKEAVIIGGGITGLAAALALQGKADYMLLEKDSRLGGKILTEKAEGFIIEGGPDCFLSEKPWVAQLAASLGISHRLLGTNEEQKGTFVLSKGRLHRLPEGLMLLVPTQIWPFVINPLISWPGKLRMALDLFLPPKKGGGDESLASFVRRRLGQEALDKIAGPLIGGIHAGDPDTMSLQASFPRFLNMEQNYGSITKAMLAARKHKAVPQATQDAGVAKTYFMSFRDGLGELTAAVIARLDQERLKTGAPVKSIASSQEEGKRIYVVELENGTQVRSPALILAIPAGAAALLVRDLDPEMSAALKQMPAVSSATVSLAFKAADIPRKLEGFGFVVPAGENRKIMAVTYSSLKWAGRVPDASFVLLRVFVGGAHQEQLAQLDDGAILKLVGQELHDILAIKTSPLFARIYRWIKGMPQYTLGHLDRMSLIEQRAGQLPGFYLAGGSYRGVGIGDCINGGTKAAEGALQYLQENKFNPK